MILEGESVYLRLRQHLNLTILINEIAILQLFENEYRIVKITIRYSLSIILYSYSVFSFILNWNFWIFIVLIEIKATEKSPPKQAYVLRKNENTAWNSYILRTPPKLYGLLPIGKGGVRGLLSLKSYFKACS